jgi:transcriptional regulator with XRE-family HTH domain
MQRFGEKLRILRKRRAMTLKELAGELGFSSHGSVGDLESGRKKPSLEVAIKISHIFGVSVDLLVKDEFELDD